jgi:glycosyltransferase involved in cell wall biosynthesis
VTPATGGRALRVALLSPVFWPEVRRGSERFARDLADGLIAQGHAPTLITSHRGAPTRTVESGLPVIRLWRPPEGRLERRMFEEHLTHVPFSYAELRRGRYDVAHALYPTDALAAARWRSRTGRPAVLSYMGIPHRRGLANRRRRPEITRRAFAGSSAVVMLSEAAATASERWLGFRPRVITPGIDLDAFAPGGARARGPTILCPAAVDVPRKRVGLLIEAFARVRRDRADARLVLSRPPGSSDAFFVGGAGGGSAALPDGVELADLDDREALIRAYRSAWVCALPSLGEAFGLVLAEALACGTPVVGSNDGGIPELIDRPEIGRLFDGEDPESLASALLECLELAGMPGTQSACRARVEPLSREAMVASYLSLYRELVG